jgi:hypothetical protein
MLNQEDLFLTHVNNLVASAVLHLTQVNEAALLAAKRGADAISAEMVDYAYDKVLMGVERKSAVRSRESLRRTAYHESGHALVSLCCCCCMVTDFSWLAISCVSLLVSLLIRMYGVS